LLSKFLEVAAAGFKISRDFRRGARRQPAKEVSGRSQVIEIGGAELPRAVLRRRQEFFHRLRQLRGVVEPHDASGAFEGVRGARERLEAVTLLVCLPARQPFFQGERVCLQFRAEQIE